MNKFIMPLPTVVAASFPAFNKVKDGLSPVSAAGPNAPSNIIPAAVCYNDFSSLSACFLSAEALAAL